ncbi:unnamed protein product [Protopolystoma xenopodis]|uniref:Uncharacterized protein n=1 Tax=Protopolystoma xenopodis TaxID=117903 RepID=A0A3S5AS98_9PLAT|nr:unnamed protein product [Protopolystoma xenopodis]
MGNNLMIRNTDLAVVSREFGEAVIIVSSSMPLATSSMSNQIIESSSEFPITKAVSGLYPPTFLTQEGRLARSSRIVGFIKQTQSVNRRQPSAEL